MKAYVDKDTCIGCGLCPEICPEIFKMEDDGKAVASKNEVARKFNQLVQRKQRSSALLLQLQ